MMFAKVVTKYIGTPFKKGGKSKVGYDCLGFVISFLKDMDKELPESYGEWNMDNYTEFYTSDPKGAEKCMCEAFKTFGKSVKPSHAVAGDLLVVRHMNGSLFPAIYCGSGNAIASFLGVGVRVFALKNNNRIHMARRI